LAHKLVFVFGFHHKIILGSGARLFDRAGNTFSPKLSGKMSGRNLGI